MVGVQVEAPAGQVAVTADQVAQEVTAVGAGQVAQKVTAVVLGRDLTAVALEEPRQTVTTFHITCSHVLYHLFCPLQELEVLRVLFKCISGLSLGFL